MFYAIDFAAQVHPHLFIYLFITNNSQKKIKFKLISHKITHSGSFFWQFLHIILNIINWLTQLNQHIVTLYS